LLHRILLEESQRFELDDRRLRFLFIASKHTEPPAGVREEAYPELWDQYPLAYLRLLSAAKLLYAHRWALTAIERSHPNLMEQATPDELLGMLSAPYPDTVRIALDELHRRFDPLVPDWELLDRLLKDDRPFVLEIAREWIEETVSLWIKDIPHSLAWLQTEDPETRELVINLVTANLTHPADKQRWADEIVKLLDGPTENLEGPLRVARWVLLDEMAERLPIELCLELIGENSPAMQGLGAAVLFGTRGCFRGWGKNAFWHWRSTKPPPSAGPLNRWWSLLKKKLPTIPPCCSPWSKANGKTTVRSRLDCWSSESTGPRRASSRCWGSWIPTAWMCSDWVKTWWNSIWPRRTLDYWPTA
jgi:hypothetical protein